MAQRKKDYFQHQDYYALAKHYQYDLRDLPQAFRQFKAAIRHGQKVDSAIKDAAAVLHQMGDTKDACQFLKEHRHMVKGDLRKFDNLLKNLEKQITPSGKFMNKYLLLTCPKEKTQEEVKKMFRNCSRIQNVSFYTDLSLTTQSYSLRGTFVLLSFQSYSSGKKTLQTFQEEDGVRVFWVNINKLIVTEATIQDSHFYSFYHGDSLWPWVTLLPETSGGSSGGWSKRGKEEEVEMERWLQGEIRKRQNEWKFHRLVQSHKE